MNELAGVSKAPLTMKPGMSQVIHAGETFRIGDVNGEEIAVEAREDVNVIAFIAAFDDWRSARKAGVQGSVLDSLENAVEVAFVTLPGHVRRELPSARVRALSLPAG